MEDTMGTTVLPSVKASTETSGPVEKFLDDDAVSALAEDLILHHGLDGAHGFFPRVSAMMTPLPNASPSALTTAGSGQRSR